MPPDDRTRAKEYQRKKQILALFSLALTPAVLAVMIISPLSLLWKSSAMGWISNAYGVVGVYFIFLSLFMLLFDLPVAFYSSFYLEHRYQLSNQSLWGWVKEWVKKCLLSFFLSLVLVEALYGLIWKLPGVWWIIAWAGYVAVSYILGKIFPVLIVPLFYRYGKVEDESLRQRILKLVTRFGLPVENIYSLNLSKTTKKANAAFMGLGRTKRVVLSDTLISGFSAEEIETVVAHEIGHYRHHDIWKQLVLGVATSFLAFWIAFQWFGPVADRFGFQGPSDVAGMPLLFLIFYLFGLFLMPIRNAFSRYLERAADRFALSAGPGREAFVCCMQKLGALNLADPAPHPLYEWFFYDHPSISKRIRMAQNE